VCPETGQRGRVRSGKGVLRADGWLINPTQPAWNGSVIFIRSVKVHGVGEEGLPYTPTRSQSLRGAVSSCHAMRWGISASTSGAHAGSGRLA
jgi:hypothetical protein